MVYNNKNMAKKYNIAIIGGGITGVGILKALSDYKHFNVYLFEKENGLGGVWYTNDFLI